MENYFEDRNDEFYDRYYKNAFESNKRLTLVNTFKGYNFYRGKTNGKVEYNVLKVGVEAPWGGYPHPDIANAYGFSKYPASELFPKIPRV